MIQWRSSWERYALAVVVTAVASLLYILAGPADVDSDLRYFGFTLAVLISSILAGLGPGILATALGGFVSAYFLLPPIFSIQVASPQRTAHLILFVGEGVLVSFIGNMIRDACTEDTDVHWAKRYLTAVLFVVGATILKLLSWRDFEREMPFALYYAVTVASAWSGGFGPGLVATLLATVLARYFFIDPVYSLSVHSPMAAARVFLFITEGIILSILAGRYITARRLTNHMIERIRGYGERLWKSSEDARALRAISRDVVWEWDIPSAATIGNEDSGTADEGSSFTLWLKRIHPRDRLKVIASLKAAMEEGRLEWCDDYRRLIPGKGYVHVSDQAFILRDNAWNPVRVVGRSADVTDVKSAPHGFESEGAYRALFENNPHAMLLADGGLHIVDANDAACDVLGYTREAVRKLGLADVLPGPAKGMLLELTPEEPTSIAFEEDCVRASGERFRAKISAAIVSGIEKTSADRLITIEEMAEAEMNS